jgi:queuine tRNA-ribosyltransferase
VSAIRFDLEARDGRARAGVLHTPHGVVPTPVFAPVGTQATVKALSTQHLDDLGAALILANTYHLFLRPGEERIRRLGGLHAFMGWTRPILTDSGGYQVFSLAETRRVDHDGVTFRSHIDGSTHRLTPEAAVAIQEALGADIIMVLDECAPPSDRRYNEQAMARTHDWAQRCLSAKRRSDQALFGIVQGGVFPDLRRDSARFIASLPFSGIAIGGLSVGETKVEMHAMLDVVTTELPPGSPRYLMGVGSPEDIVEAVVRGIDMFDCVLPTRMARNHAALTRRGRLNLRNAAFGDDPRPIDEACDCYTCLHHSRAYLRHLIVAQEMLAATLVSIHNLRMLICLTSDLRQAIVESRVADFAESFRRGYRKHRTPEA